MRAGGSPKVTLSNPPLKPDHPEPAAQDYVQVVLSISKDEDIRNSREKKPLAYHRWGELCREVTGVGKIYKTYSKIRRYICGLCYGNQAKTTPAYPKVVGFF